VKYPDGVAVNSQNNYKEPVMPENPLVSVIVPVFNAEKYITACLDSIVTQTYKNLEIIIVDDGSTDKSLETVSEYALKDGRIAVIRKPHLGVSEARNAGLDAASGAFVMFVDADDYVGGELVSRLLKACTENDLDVASCNYYYIIENSKRRRVSRNKCRTGIVLSGRELISELFSEHFWFVWGRLYRRSSIGLLRFDPDMRLCEDQKFVFEFYETPRRGIIDPGALYCHMLRTDSTMARVFPDDADNIRRFIAYVKDRAGKTSGEMSPAACRLLYTSTAMLLTVQLRLRRGDDEIAETRAGLKEYYAKLKGVTCAERTRHFIRCHASRGTILYLRRKYHRVLGITE